jgi:hypothetical protein
MKHPPKGRSKTSRAVIFGLLPCLLGLGAAQYLRWTDAVWLTIASWFWPIVLTVTSAAILIRLVFSPFEDRTSAVCAWLTLVLTWFYVPMWATSVELPRSAAVVDRSGNVHLATRATRQPGYKIWFLTSGPGTKIVHDVTGQVAAHALVLDYTYAEPYVAMRRDQDDLLASLSKAASAVLLEEVRKPRASRIALLEDTVGRKSVLESICRAAVADRAPCPINMRLTPEENAAAPGAIWSKLYTEEEALQERHLPTLVRLLTQTDTPLLDKDKVFSLLLDIADTITPISQVAQKPYWLSDEQFAVLIARILASPQSGNDAAAIVARVTRLKPEQHRALRAKALDEASIATLLENAASLHISDSELTQVAPRAGVAFSADPAVAVRALEVFAGRLPPEAQHDAVVGIVKANASYALKALEHLNFSSELRQLLMKKVLIDAEYEDFAKARLTKERLQVMFSSAELRSLIEMAVKRSETSESWMNFTLSSLTVREMTPAQRSSLLTGLLFKSPRAALEFVSENRRYLEPEEVNDVTRDYTRTIAADLCLHLSHRNANRRMEYFSEDQLQIFRDCAAQTK